MTQDKIRAMSPPAMTKRGYKRKGTDGTYHEVLDYTVLEWEEGHALIAMPVQPKHRNRGSSIHGGVIASLIDIAGDMAGIWTPDGERKTVTINLNVNFISGTSTDLVHARGTRAHATRGTLFSNAEIFEPDTGKLLANGQGVYKLLRPGTTHAPGISPDKEPKG
ncbi:MAG TPA: hypothetical protein DCE33_08060 [Rhodospirillaceae bacterium]|nr:hypothetical protein [Rhodospirillaceae bacterium]